MAKRTPRRTLIIPAEQVRGEALLDLARERFANDLRPIEQQVILHSCGYEDPSDYAGGDPARSASGRPFTNWQGQALRPALLRWLLTDPDAFKLLEPRGLRVWNAHISNTLDLSGCRTLVRLELRYCLVEGPVLLATTELSSLYVRNCTLQRSLNASNLRLRGPLVLEDITAAETLRFDAATIEGGVHLTGATLQAEGVALSMQGATIANDLQLRPGLQSAGSIVLRGIRVGGLLSLSGAKLTTAGTALNVDNATIHWSLFLRDRFHSAGEVRMIGAVIGGQLDCSGATLEAESLSLALDHVRVRGSVLLGRGFVAAGAVEMRRSWVGGNLTFEESSLRSFTGDGMEVQGDFVWVQILDPFQTSLDLSAAKIQRIRDDNQSWPDEGNLRLDGLVLQDFHPLCNSAIQTTGRIAWLNLQPKSSLATAQPWMHLAELLEKRGHSRASKRVLRELRKHRTEANWSASKLKFVPQLWNKLVGRVEERQLRLLYPLMIISSLIGAMFYRDYGTKHPRSGVSYQAMPITDQQRSPDSPAPLTPLPTTLKVSAPPLPATAVAPVPATAPPTSTEKQASDEKTATPRQIALANASRASSVAASGKHSAKHQKTSSKKGISSFSKRADTAP